MRIKVLIITLITCLVVSSLSLDLNTVRAEYLESPYSSYVDLVNADFEEELTAEGKIPGWTQTTGGSAGMTLDQSISVKPNGISLKLDDTWSDQSVSVISDPVILDKIDGRYLVSTGVYVSEGAPQIYITFYDESGNKVNDFNKYFGNLPKDQWTTVSFQVEAPKEAKTATIMLYSSIGGLNTIYFDEVRLMHRPHLHILNPGFEDDLTLDGKIPGWTQAMGNTRGMELDTGIFEEGFASLKVSDKLTTDSVGVKSDPIPLKEEQDEYNLSASAFATNGGAMLYLYFYDQSGNQLAAYDRYFSIPSNQWTPISLTAESPAGASEAVIMLYSGLSAVSTVNYDNISLQSANYRSIKIGTPLSTVAATSSAHGQGPNGEEWTYVVANGSPAIFYVLDTTTGRKVYSYELEGAMGAWALEVASDNSVYMGSFSNGKLYRWIPGTDRVLDLGQPISKQSFIWELTSDNSDNNGRIFGGTYSGGAIFMYDPINDEFTDYGNIMGGQEYVRSLDIWQGNIYAGLGTKRAAIVELNLANREKNEILLPESHRDNSLVEDLDIHGHFLFSRVTDSSDLLVFNLETKEWIDIIEGVKGLAVSSFDPQDKFVYFIKNDGYLYAYDPVQKEEIRGTASDLWSARNFGWSAMGDTDFPGLSLVSVDYRGNIRVYNPETKNAKVINTEIMGGPAVIRSIVTGPDGKIYVSGYPSGGLASYDPVTGEHFSFPSGTIGQVEGFFAHNGSLYMGIYPKADILSYNPLESIEAGVNPKVNFSLSTEGQDRPFAFANIGNLIAIGTVPDYGKKGGLLAIFDPKTGEQYVRDNIVEDQSVISLASDGEFVYGGTSVWGGLGSEPDQDHAKLFIWDVTKREKVWEGTPVLGAKVITGLAVDHEGYLWGLTGGTLFKFNPKSKEVILTVELYPFVWEGLTQAWKMGSLNITEEGFLYGAALGNMFVFNPSTLEFQTIYSNVDHVTRDDSGEFFFSRGTDVYQVVMPIDDEAPRWPEAPKLTATHVTHSTIELKWTNAADNVGVKYYVLQKDNEDEIVILNSNAKKYVFDDLLSNTTYRFTIKAIDAKGNESTKLIQEVTTLESPPVDREKNSGIYAPSNNASISDLQVTVAGKVLELSPSFSPNQLSYTIEETNTDEVEVKVSLSHDRAQLTFNGDPVVESINIKLQPGKNILELKVESESGLQNIYTISIYRNTNHSEIDPESNLDLIFTDIHSHWALDEIREAVKKGLVKGYPDGTFRPNYFITRAEFVVLLARIMEWDGTSDLSSFADNKWIPDWSSKAIAQAVDAGVLKGYEDGSIRPNALITRAEMSVMICRSLQLCEDMNRATSFSDDELIPSWAKGAVEALRGQNVITGREGNLFDAGKEATRAEALVMLLRLN